MRIVFFGLPLAALSLLRDGHQIALASICRPEAPGLRRLTKALSAERVLIKPSVDDEAMLDRVRTLSPELLVSWFWTTRLPPSLVACARDGGFGVHPSLLPRWRGPDPYFWAIDAGDAITGVTAHRLDADYDTGAILGRREVSIDARWDSWQLARALDRPSLQLMLATVRAFADGDPPRERPQDEALATDAPAPDEGLLEIDFERDAESIVRRIRAAAPYPGAWTFIGDEAVVVTRAKVVERPRALVAGEATVVDGLAVVAAGRGGVALLAGRIVGDDEGPEKSVDFASLAALLVDAGRGTDDAP